MHLLFPYDHFIGQEHDALVCLFVNLERLKERVVQSRKSHASLIIVIKEEATGSL